MSQTKKRSRLVSLLMSTLFFVILFLAITNRVYNYHAEDNYTKTTCTITSSQKTTRTEGGGRRSRSYTAIVPQFTYTVKTLDGRQVPAQGYSGPGNFSVVIPEEANAVINKYQVGQSYPCWYHPLQPSMAYLAFDYDGDSKGSYKLLMVGIVADVISLVALSVGYSYLIGFFQQILLRCRGVVTQGTISNHKTYVRNRETTIQSIISFNTPNGAQTAIISENYPLGQTVPVLYDPQSPANATIGSHMPISRILVSLIIGLFITILTLWWYINGNFYLLDSKQWLWPWEILF